jgi:ribosomal protein S18 acetylase RimI-like enzyme
MSSCFNWSRGQSRETEHQPVRIREVTEEDLLALEWEGQYSRFRLVYRRAMKEAQQGTQVLLVAELNAMIIGQIFIQLNSVRADPRPQPYTGYLYSLRVKPDYRNRGIGSMLIESAEETLQERAYRRILIGVAKVNQDARRLYERHGYHVIAEDPGEWSFVDHNGQLQYVVEPTYILEKIL